MTRSMKNMKTYEILLLIALILSSVTIRSQNPKTEQIPEHDRKEVVASKIYLILDVTVNDSRVYEQYRVSVAPIIKKYGGSYLVRSGGMSFDNDPKTKVIPIEGNWNPNRLIILEWDSIEQLQLFSKSEEYLKIVGLRTNSASTKSIVVNEYIEK